MIILEKKGLRIQKEALTHIKIEQKICTNMGNSMPTSYNPNGALNAGSRTSTLGGRSAKSKKSDSGGGPENSRVLFLLYLIHRTWNIMVETVDLKNKRYSFRF